MLKIIESHDDVQGDPVLLEARSVVRRKYSLQVPGGVVWPCFSHDMRCLCGSLDVLGDRVLVNSGDCETWKSLSVSTVARGGL
jgi:hypothetical protein